MGKGCVEDRHSWVKRGHGEHLHNTRRCETPARGINAPIAGQKDAHLVAQLRQLFGQAPYNVGHTTLFDKGNRLRSDHQDLEAHIICHASLRLRIPLVLQTWGGSRRSLFGVGEGVTLLPTDLQGTPASSPCLKDEGYPQAETSMTNDMRFK